MNTWQFHLLNWEGLGLVWAISVCFFTSDYLSEHSHCHTGVILLIIRNLPSYLHLALCCFVWLTELKCAPHPSHHKGCFRGSLCNIERLKVRALEP